MAQQALPFALQRCEVRETQTADAELVERLVHRDEAALASLYDRYGRLTYSLVVRVLGDHEMAEEVVQEVFLKVWRQPQSYVPELGRFQTWLLSVARNRAIDELRRRRDVLVDPIVLATFSNGAHDLAELALMGERRSSIRQALGQLPPEQRQAIELAYFGGLTQREIAERLGEALGTVKTRIRLGMQKLRAGLESQGWDDSLA